MKQRVLRSMLLAGVMALACSPAPVLAADPSPSPRPLPIKKTTVELQAPEAKQKSSGGVHFERPPLMNRSFRLVPRQEAKDEAAREMAAPAPAAPAMLQNARPAPTPTPTPTPTPAGKR